jgi:hypothetical protein
MVKLAMVELKAVLSQGADLLLKFFPKAKILLLFHQACFHRFVWIL